jgi:ribosomal protein S18 acetylase RimI-like enzyme
VLTLRSAEDPPFADLLALWNGAYADYIVPLLLDEAMLRRHLRRSGIDLRRSVIGESDGEPFGLSLAAFREDRAWIGGFGVLAAFRRRGLASALMQAHLARLDVAGVSQTGLEVIDINPAREVYRRSGFAETRTLLMYEGTVEASGDPGEVLTAGELAARHARLNPTRATWRREMPTLLDSLSREDAVAIGIEGAYAVGLDQGERIHLLDAAAIDAGAAARLLRAAAARWPARPLRLVDEPEGSPLAAACVAAGMANPLRQVEMARPVNRGG